MSNRITMNTDSLQAEFKEIYRDFFSKSDLVASVSFSIIWTPVGISQYSTIPYVKQKIPTRCYIGLSRNEEKHVNLDKLMFYHLTNKVFEEVAFDQMIKDQELIKNIIREFCVENEIGEGLDISILCENSRGHGIGFSGSLGAALAACLFIMSGKIEPEDLGDYDNLLNSEKFKEMHQLAWKIEFIARGGAAIGVTSLIALHNDPGPIFYCSEDMHENTTVEDLKNLKVKYYPLLEKFEEDVGVDQMPFDYAMVFTGVESDTYQIENMRKFTKKFDRNIRGFIHDHFKGLTNEDDDFVLKFFNGDNSTLECFDQVIVLFIIKYLRYLYEVINGGMTSRFVDNFIDHVNVFRFMVSMVEKQSGFANEMMTIFNKTKVNEDEMVGIMPVYTGKLGGGCLVVMKENYSRNTFEATIEKLKDKYSNCEIEYADWIDGPSQGGVVLHQYISKQKFSNYIKKGNELFKSNKGEIYIGDYNRIVENETKGLILDTINKKIILNGKKLTSKDIPSQTTTIEVLEILLDNIGIDVSNQNFSVSSYSKNKNEMLGKIILPLIKLVESTTGKKLSLICKGSLGDYFIKLSETDLKIGIIRNL